MDSRQIRSNEELARRDTSGIPFGNLLFPANLLRAAGPVIGTRDARAPLHRRRVNFSEVRIMAAIPLPFFLFVFDFALFLGLPAFFCSPPRREYFISEAARVTETMGGKVPAGIKCSG